MTKTMAGISLRTKLIIAFAAMALIPLILLNFMTFRTTEQALMKTVFERNRSLAANIAEDINQMFEEKIRMMKIAVHNTDIMSMDAARLVPALSPLTAQHHELLMAIVLTPDGDLLARSDGKKVKANYNDREYFHTATRTGATTISDVLRSKTTGKLDIGIAEPIKSPDQTLRGMLVIGVSLHKIIDRISKTKIGTTGYAYVVNKNGKILMHPDQSLVDKSTDFSGLTPVKAAISGNSGSLEYEFNGRKILASYDYVPSTGWGLVVQQPLDEAMSAAASLRNTNIIIMIITMFAAVLIVFVLAGIIFKPIAQLTVAAGKVAEGNLTAQASFKSSDEIGALSSAFNNMTTQLLSRERALQQSQEEYRRSEEALRASEEQYRAIFENSGTALIIIEDDTTVSICNKEFEKLYGANKPEIEGLLKWTELVARPDDLQRMKEYHHLRRSSPGGVPQTYEFQMITREGMLRDIVISVTVMPGTRQSLASLLDITERRQAEVALKERAERIQLLLNSTGEGIYGIDLEGRCTFINPAALQALGYDSPDEFLGIITHELIHHTRPDGSPYPASECKILKTFHTGKAISVSDEVLWRKDGSSFPVEYSSHPVINAADKVVGAVCTFHDITERRLAEEKIKRMATIIEHTAEGIVLTDKDWVILYANPAFKQITGYESDEIIGQRTTILKSDAHDSKFYRNIRNTMFRGEVWSGRIINKKKDGTLYEVDASGSPVLDEAGNIINFIGIQHDITNEIRLERQLRQKQKMEAIGTLAGGIAHDFNNILTAIMGYSQLMSRKLPAKSPLHSYLGHVLKASSRASELVKQILTFSRQSENERKPVQLSLIIEEVLFLIRSSIPSSIEICKEIDIVSHKDIVFADSTQIHQVLMNLCTNAAHAMRNHGGILTVGLSAFHVDDLLASRQQGLEPGPYAKLTVSDSGHGMDATTLERIFDPYFTTKRPGEGTGLGLAVVQGIVNSHSGIITVYSEPGRGTSFTILLPVLENPQEVNDEFVEQLPAGTERILFVDDEESLCGLGREMLENLGYKVTVNTGSLEALDFFRAQPADFDLIITDMTMPGLSGIDLAVEILSIRPEIPIILYSGFLEEGLKERAQVSGISEVVMKPYDVVKIATIIRNVIDKAGTV